MRMVARARAPLAARGLTTAIATLAVLGAIASPAPAADYHAFICTIPPGDIGEGSAAPTDDMSFATSGSAYMQAGASCAAGGGGNMYTLMDGEVSHLYGSSSLATFSAPAGLSIAAFKMWRYEQDGPVQPYGSPETNLSYNNVVSVQGTCSQSYSCSSRGTTSPWYAGVNEISVGGLTGVNYLQWSAACGGGPGGTCPASGPGYSAVYLVYSLDVTLEDPTPPTASEITVPTGTVAGLQQASFHATDSASGVYSAWIDVDGSPLAGPSIINTNGGTCQNLGATKDGLRSYLHPQPCPLSANGTLNLNTVTLKDGLHNASLHIDDAAGNEDLAKTWTFTTDNAPTITKAPSIAGSAQVGATLTATDGTFSAPSGAGSLSAVTGQWLRCTDAKAQECTEIPGATAATFSPTAEDVGYYLVYQNTAADNDGSTTSASHPTIAVAAAPGCATSECSHTGAGNGGTGGNGGNGTGTGIMINLNNPGSGGPTLLGSNAKWNITIHVTPKRVQKNTRVTISGTVTTTPRPATGKLVNIHARTVTRTWRVRGTKRYSVNTYGKWMTFAELRAASNGTWETSYRFHFGGKHTYQMQAIAPQEGGYQNPTGESNIQTVIEH